VSDWKFAQKDASEELASLSYFSFKKSQKLGDCRLPHHGQGIYLASQRPVRALFRASGQTCQPEDRADSPDGLGEFSP